MNHHITVRDEKIFIAQGEKTGVENKNQLIREIRRYVTDEAFRAMGFSRDSLVRKLFGVFMFPASNRFAYLAADFDQDVAEQGINLAVQKYLPRFIDQSIICGCESIPVDGPLLIVSNHPGTLDGFLIIASLPREDIKLIISGVPFVQAVPSVRKHLIYTPSDARNRLQVVRQGIQHLQDGGLLALFPSGRLDPDPAYLPGADAALKQWSRSLEIFLQKVPETRVVIAIVSGVFAADCLHNPLTHFAKEFWKKQRIAEYIQVINMILFGKKYLLNPKVTFGKPLKAGELVNHSGSANLMDGLMLQAQRQLDIHTASKGC